MAIVSLIEARGQLLVAEAVGFDIFNQTYHEGQVHAQLGHPRCFNRRAAIRQRIGRNCWFEFSYCMKRQTSAAGRDAARRSPIVDRAEPRTGPSMKACSRSVSVECIAGNAFQSGFG